MSESPAKPGGASDNPAVAATDETIIAGAAGIKVPVSLLREDVVENAVDDSEDLPDDDFIKATQTKNYTQRHHHNRPPGRLGRVQELVPFPFLPNVRPLTISDLESCVALEDAAFADPAHRATREKFEYRLSVCPELCLGLFCTVAPDKTEGFEIDTLPTAHPVETGRENGAKSVLMAHIVATRSHDEIVTDKAMDYPRDFRTNKRNTTGLGHQEAGGTICIHSFAVHPKLQGCGLGKLLMKSYLQQLRNSECALRCSLICRGYLVTFYERFGFLHLGESSVKFGGGGWHNMSLSITGLPSYSARPKSRG
ncbi:Polyamine N-acetyltransferase 1 [Daldinia childiae]|uniref:Polyamine N-acetyltransferase 1 n=1 Tax=Daldinia childiae TaxID=326645 RepID=UPI00144685A1|nr:Polyamine N-acetyltransferase 1 [Daldinia childiae]KAF3067490.1 Polyamine N-acetyltransferase 1 [Daldinia childiae]